MAWTQLVDTADDAARRWHELVGEVFVERHGVDAFAQGRISEQRLELRREDEAAGFDSIVQGFDADPIAGENHE